MQQDPINAISGGKRVRRNSLVTPSHGAEFVALNGNFIIAGQHSTKFLAKSKLDHTP